MRVKYVRSNAQMTNDIHRKSMQLGAWVGLIFGAILGAATGALSGSIAGVAGAAGLGAVLGATSGVLTGILTLRTAGDTGGVSTGAYTGMVFGAFFGLILGIFIPESFRLRVLSLDILILNVIFQGRFEAAILVSFLMSCLDTAVGAWVGGRNLKPRGKG